MAAGGGGARARPNVLVTGTPGTGKTTTCSLLADAAGLRHVNVGDLVREKGLHDGWDEDLECLVINEDLLQDAGCWIDAATLAASHLHGSDYARVLQRWADYVLRGEHNMWRALILYVAAGALPEALETLLTETLRKNQRPDTAAMFLLACHEIYSQITTESEPADDTSGSAPEQSQKLRFPSKNVDDEDLIAVSEVFGQYQQELVHLCMDTEPTVD